ncbi:MAG TPA: glycerate kinase [Solirubrobacteraceae bacterium]|nr:glycerate kinase [Solirubrobacteraceae bacterium]
MISRTVLVAPEPFGELSAARVAAAIGRGLRGADALLEVDLLPVQLPDRPPVAPGAGDTPDDDGAPDDGGAPVDPRVAFEPGELDALGYDKRMRAARAVILGAGRLDERTLLGSATFELATRARQAGVPAYAVAGENALSLFDARILDLQVVLQARDTRALRRAGEKLAGLV